MIFHSLPHAGPIDFATFYEAIYVESTSKPAAVCRLLDIKSVTLSRYLRGTATPPAALVRLLFLESHYGKSAVAAHSENGAALSRRLAHSLQAELARLAGHVIDLERENAELRAAGAYSRQFAANSSRFAKR